MRPTILLSALFLAAGCTIAAHHKLDELYGDPDPARFDQVAHTAADREAWEKVAPVLQTRCAVCHACYDAPCQLNLTSWEGVTRGASKDNVYALRLLAASPTRLGIDAQTSAEWRAKGFHPVLNERRPTVQANAEASVMHRILALKRTQKPQAGILPSDRYDFSLDRAEACPTIEEMDEIEKKRPELGMPFGMPQLTEGEYSTLTGWIAAGAPYAPPADLPAAHTERVRAWETFLNGHSLKERLMSRYIYEHWYLAHLYFDDLPTGEYFDLVRSKTPPGRPIEIIATVRPYDDPGVERVYYRLRRVEQALVAKTHMPYPLSAARRKHLTALFLEPDYAVTALPSYEPAKASNPFVTFQELPLRARYRLMLEEAQFTIMNFIKGPVCRGQVALNVINDLFWVSFVDPELESSELSSEELSAALDQIQLPAEAESTLPLLQWRRYSKSETRYLKAKSDLLNRHFGDKHRPDLDTLWDGDGDNPNAALTVFRHFNSATVVQGFVGQTPQTAWVVGYPLLERIHYLLVAGYNVYGSVGHELTTRMYMDFLRMEGESNFLTLLPITARDEVRDFWYRGAGDDVKEYLDGSRNYFAHQSGVSYGPGEPLPQLYAKLKKHFAPVLNRRFDLVTTGLPPTARRSLERLGGLHGTGTSILPETSFLTVTGLAGGDRQFTLLHNSAHTNISTLFREARNRLPAEDTVTLVDGFLGAYPNAFHEVSAADLPDFVDMVAGLEDEDDYAALMTKYGIRRTDERFWPRSDALIAAYRKARPVEAGLFDYNRYENR